MKLCFIALILITVSLVSVCAGVIIQSFTGWSDNKMQGVCFVLGIVFMLAMYRILEWAQR